MRKNFLRRKEIKKQSMQFEVSIKHGHKISFHFMFQKKNYPQFKYIKIKLTFKIISFKVFFFKFYVFLLFYQINLANLLQEIMKHPKE